MTGGMVIDARAACAPEQSRVRDRTAAHTRPASPLIGCSNFLLELDEFLPKVASSDCNVLVTGETGTGKELVAASIHRLSVRSERPFVAVNCAAMPETLVESELFGFDRGAFTHASQSQPGKFELAADGTIFLDEIGEMNLAAQAKLLRAVECREILRIGGRRPQPLRARLIAATNQDLDDLVKEGRFRADLFFRLNVVAIHMAPLRDRPEDIPPIVDHLLAASAARTRSVVEGFSSETMAMLLRYAWPGNVRELRNLVEAVLVAAPARRVRPEDLPEQFRRRMQLQSPNGAAGERQRLIEALTATNWNKSEAARSMHWSRMTLYRKMAKFQLR